MSFKIAGYDAQHCIYSSSKSLVYKAIDSKTKKPVIIKCLLNEYPAPFEIEAFEKSAELSELCNHPQILKPKKCHFSPNQIYLVYDDLGLIDVSSYLTQQPHNQLTINQFLSLAIQVAHIFSSIHENNVIFKDLHPGNLLIHPATRDIYITDFELAVKTTREYPTSQTPAAIEGVLGFISPEQTGRMGRAIDYRTDIYSMGACFYQMLTAQTVFSGSDAMEIVHQHIASKPESVSSIRNDVPKVISNIIDKLLSKAPENRYQSSSGLAYDLERCQKEWQSVNEIVDFPLGTHDFSQHFEVSQKLYGREVELDVLRKGYLRSKEKNLIITTVAGYPGVGKTSLVEEFYATTSNSSDIFLSGKFDQYHQSRPYSAIIEALQQWIQFTLGESSEHLKQLRKHLHEKIGFDLALLSEQVPELQPILGINIDKSKSDHKYNKRFQWVFKKFISVICQQNQITFFIDDIQWIDEASANLVQSLLDIHNCKLFLILGFRSTDIQSNLSASKLVHRLDTYEHVSAITLQTLTLENIRNLIADSFEHEIDNVTNLAEIVFSRTSGNPFFVQQFLKQLYIKQYIYFDKSKLSWFWNANEINENHISTNIADLLNELFSSLPAATQCWLKIASCVGHEFDVQMILLSQSSHHLVEQTIIDDLSIAISKGLIIQLADKRSLHNLSQSNSASINRCYRFTHDKIYQSIYNSLSVVERNNIHLTLANSLLPSALTRSNKYLILLTAEQLKNSDLTNLSSDDKNTIIQLLYYAAQIAKSSSNNHVAVEFAITAIDLLPNDCWESNYTQTLDLKHLKLECELLAGVITNLEEGIIELEKNTKDPFKLTNIICLAMQCSTSLGSKSQVVKCSIRQLSLMDVRLDFCDKSDANELITAIEALDKELSKVDVCKYDKIQPCTSEVATTRLKLLSSLAYNHYIWGLYDEFALLSMLICKYTLKDGLVTDSGITLAILIAFHNFKKDYGSLIIFQNLAFDFLETNSKKQGYVVQGLSELYTTLGSLCLPYTSTLSKSNQILEIGFERAKQESEEYLQFALLGNSIINSFAKGLPLSTLRKDLDKLDILLERYSTSISAAKLYRRLVDVLTGREKASALYKDSFSEEEWIKIADTSLFCVVRHFRIQYAFWMADYDAILDIENDFNEQLNEPGFISNIEGDFLRAVMHIRFSGQLPILVKDTQEKVQTLASINPHTFGHKNQIFEAELALRNNENIANVINLFQGAANTAAKSGFIQYQAYCHERLGEYMKHQTIEDYALIHFEKAFYLYFQWSCKIKASQLEGYINHASVNSRANARKRRNVLSNITSTSSKGIRSRSLDLSSLIKSTSILARADKNLIDTNKDILNIAVENSGAQSGALLFINNGTLSLTHSIGMQKDRYPRSLINYVFRSQKPLIISNLSKNPKWKTDSYFQENGGKSALCMPIIYRDELKGIIYLENKLLSNAFVKDRLRMLEMLMHQSAISLDNLQKYKQLENYNHELEWKVKINTSDLETTNKELAAFGYSVAHDLKSPLRKILGFSEAISQDFGERLAPQANEYLERIINSSEKMSEIIDGLSSLHFYSYSKVEPDDINLSNLVSSLISELIYKFPNHKVTTRVHDLGTLSIDSKLIKAVFSQLLSNAWKFTLHSPQPYVEVGSFSKGDHTIYYVKDNGKGFEIDHSQNLFYNFQRLHSSKDYKGQGIGLAMVKRIIDRYNGHIWAESEVNKGSTLFFRINANKTNE